MKTLLTSFAAGILFALGLGISGMTQPAKVIGFLDFFGHWDPSLMLVMVGAIGVHGMALWMLRGKAKPLFEESFSPPSSKTIDLPLLLGAVLFGVGWGLGGFCPGPALVSLAGFGSSSILFVGAMLAGMLLSQFFLGRTTSKLYS